MDPKDPEVRALAASIQEHGIQQPLVITKDGFILSGHRRHTAAWLADLRKVPCRVFPMRRDDDPDRFLLLLREFNRQRIKSLDEKLREEVVSADPEESYRVLTEYREHQAQVNADTIAIRGVKRRAEISKAKEPFLAAIVKILEDWSAFLPLSDRQIHYALLNDPPLIHASKPDSTYTNTKQNYKSLTDLRTRARLGNHLLLSDQVGPLAGATLFVKRTAGGFGLTLGLVRLREKR